MSSSLFIAKAFVNHRRHGIAKPVVRIAMLAISVSVFVILIAFAVVRGFQQEIRNKLIGFGAHVSISSFDTNENEEHLPIASHREDIKALNSIENIKSIYPTAIKPGLLRSKNQIHGIVFKGVNDLYDWDFFKNHLTTGRIPKTDSSFAQEIILSERLSAMLNLQVDSPVRAYFMVPGELQPRGRKFTVVGLYSTGLTELDEMVIIGSLSQIQKLNRWGDTLVGSYEVIVKNFSNLDKTMEDINTTLYYDLNAEDIRVSRQRFFDWLNMLDSNVTIIMVLMIIVALINVIGILLIMILEKIRIIGILKAIGSTNGLLRRIFILQSAFFIFKGAFWGNLAAIIIIWIQHYFKILPLSEDMYYMKYVPMDFRWDYFVFVNVGVVITTFLGLFIASVIIRKITPAKALRVE